MKLDISGNVILNTFLLLILFGSIIPASTGRQSSVSMLSTGSIPYGSQIDVTVNFTKVIGVNNLSLGFMLDWEWKSWRDSSIRRELAQDANFKLIRLFSHRIEPCAYWNESAKTGVFNWTDVDTLVHSILEIGAEPLICIGFYSSTENSMLTPPSMAANSITNLPYPESFAAYAAEWIKHFKDAGFSVRYYEIVNEPFHYFGWNPSNTTKLAYYVELFNAAARRMRQEKPDILISHDTSTMKKVFDYWLQNGDDIDFLDFHKYDSNTVGKFTDAEMLKRAEHLRFDTSFSFYGVDEARQKWLNARGKILPAINSESGFNSAWKNGTDPRIPQRVGAVWTSLVLRMAILKGVNYNVYYTFSSSASYSQSHGDGYGFGMVNSDNDQPWYPYYVQNIIGNNLKVGDPIVETNSSSDDIRLLASIHDRTLNLLLINKIDEPRTIHLHGLTGELNFFKIDNTISFLTPSIQIGTINATRPLTVKGYTVALLQTQLV